MATTQYIGPRIIPVFAPEVEWDINDSYEHLTMVQHQGETFMTRQYVPVGIPLPDSSQSEEYNDYWVHMSNWNAQVEAYRQEVLQYNGRISTLEDDLPISDFDSTNTVKKAIDDINDEIGSGFDSTNTVAKAIDDINDEIGSGFDSTNTVAKAIGDINDEIGSGFDSTNTVAKAIEDINTDNWVTPNRIVNDAYQVCSNTNGEYDLDMAFNIDFANERLQGCCSDSSYYYLFTYEASDESIQYIYKVSKSDTSVYTKTQYATLGHGNSMESHGEYLYVTTVSTSGVIKIEKATMAIVNTYDYNYYAICNYDNKWYGYDVDIARSRIRLLELNNDFEVTKTTYTNYDCSDMSAQGMTYDGEYFYIISAYPHNILVFNENGAFCGAEHLLDYQIDNEGLYSFEVQDIERAIDGNFNVFANYFYTGHNQVISIRTNPVVYRSKTGEGKNRITNAIGSRGAGAAIAWYAASKSTQSDLIRVRIFAAHEIYINCESLSNLVLAFANDAHTIFHTNAGTVYNTTFNLSGTVDFMNVDDSIMNNCKFLVTSANTAMNISKFIYMQNCQFLCRATGFSIGYVTGYEQQATILWYNSNASFTGDNIANWDIFAMRGDGNRFAFNITKAAATTAGLSGKFGNQNNYSSIFVFLDQISTAP